MTEIAENLDDLPLLMHHLLPWDRYRAPGIKGPYTFIVHSRECPAGCTFCIKNVRYQYVVRVRSLGRCASSHSRCWA